MKKSKSYNTDRLEELTTDFIRQRAKESLYVFAKYVIGFRDMTDHLHKELTEVISDSAKHKLIMIPRGHLKSSSCTIAYTAWRAVKDPNIRILIVSNTATNAERFLREISHIFTQNETFKAYFPELHFKANRVSKERDTTTELTIPRTAAWGEPTVQAIGVGGKVTSRHYNIIIMDDLIDESTNFEGTPMEDIIAWYKYSEGLAVKPAEFEQIIIGTRYHYNDLYQHILDNEKHFKVYIRKAIENGKPIWPERFSLETLNRIKAKQGSQVFSNQYLNDPIDTDEAKFREEHLQLIHPKKIPTGIMTFMMTDTIGDNHGDSDFANIVVGVETKTDELGMVNLYILDLLLRRVGVNSAVNHWMQMFKRNKPVAAGVERVGQSTFGLHITNQVRQFGAYIEIKELAPRGRHKDIRIGGLLPYAENLKIYVNEEITKTEDWQKFVHQWLRWPKVKDKDGLDAFAYVLDFIEQYSYVFDWNDDMEEEEEDRYYYGRGRTGY